MLVEFSVENFRSIRDEARLSMVASPGREHRDTHVTEAETGARRPIALLHSAAIYGANAAGKSNLITALDTMRRIVTRSTGDLAPLPVVPFRFDAESSGKPTTFDVTCIAGGTRYQYGFSATAEAITGEWLYAWPHGRIQLWFERDEGDQFKLGDKLMGDKEVWRRATRPDALFLATAIALNSTQMQPVFDWFSKSLHVGPTSGRMNTLTTTCYEDDRKAEVLQFLRVADFAIADVRVIDQEVSADISKELPTEVRGVVSNLLPGPMIEELRLGLKLRHLKLSHDSSTGERVELDLGDESHGTQKVVALVGPWLDALKNGLVLVCDELHDNLHPKLVRFLVDMFHRPEWNERHAQLIFTTHDTSILDQDLLRRDQIWFCERDADQATRLFPLTDFHPRKGVDNLERSYLAGRYGAVPYVRSGG